MTFYTGAPSPLPVCLALVSLNLDFPPPCHWSQLTGEIRSEKKGNHRKTGEIRTEIVGMRRKTGGMGRKTRGKVWRTGKIESQSLWRAMRSSLAINQFPFDGAEGQAVGVYFTVLYPFHCVCSIAADESGGKSRCWGYTGFVCLVLCLVLIYLSLA